MRLNYIFVLLSALSVLLSACDDLPKDDEVEVAPYNIISGFSSLLLQSQKKDDMLYVLDRGSNVYCIDLKNYSPLFNEDLKNSGISGTTSNNSCKESQALSDDEKVTLELPENTVRPKGVKLSGLDYSLNTVSFSLSPDGFSLYIVTYVDSSNDDIDGMYYVLHFDTTAKKVSNAFPLDTLTSYSVSDDSAEDVTNDMATKSTGNIARQIYANDTCLFISGNKRMFIIPIKEGKVDPAYDYYTSKSNSFISAETTETMSPYLVQEHNGNIYVSSREKDFGVHVYNYDLDEKTLSYVRKESVITDVIGNHYPVSMNIFGNKLYCSSYEKFGIFSIENGTLSATKVPVCGLSLVSDVKVIDDNYYAASFNYKIEEDMTVSTGYNHLFIRSGVVFGNNDSSQFTQNWVDGIIKNIELWKNGNGYFSVSLCQDKDYLIINQLK